MATCEMLQTILEEYGEENKELARQLEEVGKEMGTLRRQLSILTPPPGQSFPQGYTQEILAPLYDQLHKAEDNYRRAKSRMESLNYAISQINFHLSKPN